MRVGIVCEGPSDYPALEHFVGHALASSGINASFQALFPEMDNTRPEGGWALVLTWLHKYPPATRIQRFFGGGLFGGGLTEDPLDAIIIQLDTDVLGDASFKAYVAKSYGIEVKSPDAANLRAEQIFLVVSSAAALDQLTEADASKHVTFAAVESTEAWCVAAFSGQPVNSESLSESALTNAFMQALEASESKPPQANYSNVDKSMRRRDKFCAKHAVNSKRIMVDCAHFAKGVNGLIAVAP
jgi:hypothetical protein